ncbi:MAG: CBS domain-containing protein [Ktedonobacteraceae bacterium]|nr:CBS domain-containing protein [Chloroflexota bacterium]
MKVKDVMSTDVITVKEDQTRQQAASLLTKHRISGLPVVNDEGLVTGIVTEYDVISREGEQVKHIMTRGIISVSADSDLEDVRQILVNESIRRLPVLDQGRLVGIVSRADLVREAATRWICHVCGEITHSETQPEHCPRCHARNLVAASDPQAPGS